MSVADIAQTMQSKFNASAAAGLDLVFQFNIEDGENYALIVKDGTCALEQGDNPNASPTAHREAETAKAHRG